MKTFVFKDVIYPDYIRHGNHAQYIKPVAEKICKGAGIDVGATDERCLFPGAKMCDLNQPKPWNDANKLPVEDASQDYVFSSHCLEHLPFWVDAMKEWTRVLKIGGVLFLYLPHWDCEYWRTSNNPRHLSNFTAKEIKYVMENVGYDNIFFSGIDLAYSFALYGNKT